MNERERDYFLAASDHLRQTTKYDLVIGNYRYLVSADSYSLLTSHRFHPRYLGALKNIKSYDHLLHQSLDKIICERCLSSTDQIKVFLRGPHLKSIIKPILEQETILSRHFSKEEMGKLSLLWIAVLCCYEKSADLLVHSGADVNELFGRHDPQVIDEKCTVLQLLLQMDPSPKNEQLIRLVIDHGADLQARDFKGRTVLYYAVLNSRVPMTELLLEKGVDVNVADDEGMTPLLVAASNIMANELVPLLMKHGADVLAKSRNGQNALHRLAYCRWEHVVDLARVFIEKGVSLEDKEHFDHYQPIHRALLQHQYALVEFYLDHGVNVNGQTQSGKSLSYIAAHTFSIDIMELLITRGANIDQRTPEGRTALHAACGDPTRLESEVLVGLLLTAGADVLIEDNDRKTPFAIALRGIHEAPPSFSNVYLDLQFGPHKELRVAWLMIRALALKKACQPSIESTDERIIERNPKFRNYYRQCFEEIEKMKVSRLFGTCTFFQLLAKCQCQIAALMRNPEFRKKFRRYDRKEFPTYIEEINEAFNRADYHYESLLKQENVINEAVYNSLPYMVVRKVAHYTFDCCKNVK